MSGSDDMNSLLATSRLRLRPFTPVDVDSLYGLDSDPEVMRFISKGQGTPREIIAQKVLPRWIQCYAHLPPFGYWAVETLSVGQFVGWVHLRTDRISPPELELGYRFMRSAWGLGFATECARALIEMAFTHDVCDRISARTLTGNRASQRVMMKCGLVFCEHFTYSQALLPGWSEEERCAVKFGASREAWLCDNR
jgi:RimJ/RimL family protein N-acetyltransferase